MNIKMYKFLYKKMNDDIRDSEMLCDWSKVAKDEGEVELAKYFASSALERLNKSFKETHAMFENYAKKEEGFDKESVTKCLWDEIHQDLVDRYETCLKCIEKL